MSIKFYTEAIKFTLADKKKVKHWITETIKAEKKIPGKINYIFCSDDYLLALNRNYLKHDTYTDIITFDYVTAQNISGDIFISIDRIKENASKFNTNFIEELQRVIIHGILHLLGYKDKTPKEKNTMRWKEDFYIALKNQMPK